MVLTVSSLVSPDRFVTVTVWPTVRLRPEIPQLSSRSFLYEISSAMLLNTRERHGSQLFSQNMLVGRSWCIIRTMDDLDDDDDDLDDDEEDEDEDDSIPDAFTLQTQCRDYAPNYPEWLKRDVVAYIEAYSSDISKLSEFLGVNVGTLIIWKRKFGVTQA